MSLRGKKARGAPSHRSMPAAASSIQFMTSADKLSLRLLLAKRIDAFSAESRSHTALAGFQPGDHATPRSLPAASFEASSSCSFFKFVATNAYFVIQEDLAHRSTCESPLFSN